MKKLKVGSDYSGVGAFNQSLKTAKIPYDEVFACDMDKHARKTFVANYGTKKDLKIVNSKAHDAICDKIANIVKGEVKETPEFLESAELMARSFSFYYPFNVYNREIPKDPLDVYMTSPPCQGFSMAGKREGSILFYNSLEFIRVNKPLSFLFENVKGLLSHDKKDKKQEYGTTFSTWLNYLGGKSINGNPVVFPYDDSVPYHIYFQVMNAKEHGVPQNRERVFIIGIREDAHNTFTFPATEHLNKTLKDVLESDVPNKYYLSDKMIQGFINSSERNKEKGNGFNFAAKDGDDIGSTVVATCYKMSASDNYIKDGFINQDSQASAVHNENGVSPTLSAGAHGYANGYVKIKSATKEGYEVAKDGDSIALAHPNSETRRGRVGNGIAQTLDTTPNQGVLIGAIRGRNEDNPKSREAGLSTKQMLEINENGTSNALTTVQKDNVVIEKTTIIEHRGHKNKTPKIINSGVIPTLRAESHGHQPKIILSNYKIRRLTPRECFRLMDFPESFIMPCSDTQMYKQAGNSIVVAKLKKLVVKIVKCISA